jgi:hypothetical protein
VETAKDEHESAEGKKFDSVFADKHKLDIPSIKALILDSHK